MQTLIKSKDRGKANHGWLLSNFSFSFAEYYNPKAMGFKYLRVINEDYIAPQTGFPLHPHQNMEIITYIIKGNLEHTDDQGNIGTIQAGEIQRMSAGSGIYHSEKNNHEKETTHLLQIWLKPKILNIEPGYQQVKIPSEKNKLNLIAAPTKQKDAVTINQDLSLYASQLEKNKQIVHNTTQAKNYWIQLISGQLAANQIELAAGDGLGLEDVISLNISATENSHFLLFEM